MAARALKVVVVGLMLTIVVVAFGMLSCDHRRGLNPDHNGSQVATVRVNLNPGELRLPSPEAIDSVTVVIEVFNSNNIGVPNIQVTVASAPEIGSITQPDLTDSLGRTTALFINNPGIYDSTRISATAENRTGTALLYIGGTSGYTLDLRYYPYNSPKPIDSEGSPYRLYATLVDSLHQGVPNCPVSFEIVNQVGRIEYNHNAIPLTDIRGRAQANFYNTELDETLNPDHAEIRAATLPPGDRGFLVASVSLPQIPANNSISLQIVPDKIIGNPDIHAVLTAILKDTYNGAIVDRPVIFSWNQRGIQALDSVYTDYYGMASNNFTPAGQVSRPETVQVLAQYRPGSPAGALATGYITVLPIQPHGFLNITLQKDSVMADGYDTCSIFISAQDSLGGPVPDGDVVTLTHTGTGYLHPPQVTLIDGRGRSRIVSAPRPGDLGPDTIFASYTTPDSITLADSAVVHFIAGYVQMMSLVYPETTVTLVAGSGDTCSVIAYAIDANGNPVADGTQISFKNFIPTSTLNPVTVGTVNGYARSVYQVGVGTGDDNVYPWVANPRNPNDTIRTVQPARFHCIPPGPAGSLDASLQKQSVVADGVDTSSIYVTVLDRLGNPIEDGTVVSFAHTGIGVLMAPQLPTFNGVVRNRLTAPSNIRHQPRVDSIFVRCQFSDSSYAADTCIVNYVPGIIHQLEFVYPETTVTMIAGSGDTCSVILSATDANGNPVSPGTQVIFGHTLPCSNLFPQPPDTVNGYITNIYQVGDCTGDDNVSAWVLNPTNPNDTIRTIRPVIFRCISSSYYTINLSTTQSNIHVDGDSTLVIATVLPLSPWEGPLVAFQITDSPGHDTTGQKPSFDRNNLVEYDTVMTNINGQAMVQLFSGTRSGPVTIRACTVAFPPETLSFCDQRSLVTITADPPAFVNIAFSGYGEAENPNSPERFDQVAAIVTDRFNNPVDYGTAVYFSLIPSDIGSIERESLTGSARPYHPDSAAGVAYTRIIYACSNTYDAVRVIATTAGDSAEIIDTSGFFPLPIYQGSMSLNPNPGELWTPDSSCSSTDTSLVTATLTDGGGCPIEGGIVHFTAEAGQIIGPSVDTTDINGHATAMFMIRGCDIPDGPHPRIEAAIRATLYQNPSVFAVTNIICTRPRH